MSQIGVTRPINCLNSTDRLSSSDLLALYSQYNSDTRKVSLNELLSWLNSQAIATQDNKVTQYIAPTTGSTVLLLDTQNSVWLQIKPAGTLATLTLTFPLSSNVPDRTEILINTTNTLTSLTLNGNGAAIVGGITTLSANGFCTYRFDLVNNTWYRVG